MCSIRIRALEAFDRLVGFLGLIREGPWWLFYRRAELHRLSPVETETSARFAWITSPGVPPRSSPALECPPTSRVSYQLTLPHALVSIRAASRFWQRLFSRRGQDRYDVWVRESKPSRFDLRAQRRWAAGQSRSFSLITPVADPASWEPAATARSVLDQTYSNWEWILVTPDARSAGLARLPRDGRVRVIQVPASLPVAAAWNTALREASGDYAILLDDRDCLCATALYEVARSLQDHGESDIVYSDEDQLKDGLRQAPRFKPAWSPELLLAHNYIGRLVAFRTATAGSAGGFRSTFPCCEEWDLWLRLARSGASIRRLARCLYHAAPGGRPQPAAQHTVALLEDHCNALACPAHVAASDDTCRISWMIRHAPIVSVIIPSRNASVILQKCVRGVLEQTDYRLREVVIVDNGSTEPDVLEFYRTVDHRSVRVVPFAAAFNFSAACNLGAANARGDLLLFLNNDIEIIEPGWLDELVRWAQLPHVGVVGPKLLYPDRRIQHAGVVFGLGLVGHIFSRAPERTSGVFGSTEWYRNYQAVTGACQMIRGDVFRQLGGFDERFRLTFSDVVLCMEAWKAGYRVVYTPYSRLIHHESLTRKTEDPLEDMTLLATYLRAEGFTSDPFFHPELDATSLVPLVRPPFAPTPEDVVRGYIDRVLATATG
jgi:GT2 family glycosyltransferase